MFLQIIHLFLHFGMFSIVLRVLVDDVLVTVAKVSLNLQSLLSLNTALDKNWIGAQSMGDRRLKHH